jgi:hypothetical protein
MEVWLKTLKRAIQKQYHPSWAITGLKSSQVVKPELIELLWIGLLRIKSSMLASERTFDIVRARFADPHRFCAEYP